MGKPTGQMQEHTQELLDHYNELFNWEYNEMCEFIENYGETEFQTHYTKYHQLVDDYGQNLIDEFANHFDIDTIEHFEDMYQGQYKNGGDFAESLVSECYSMDIPSWVVVDWQSSWDNALSYDYTEIGEGYIFNDNY